MQRTCWGVLAFVAVVFAFVAGGYAAAAKSYQFTGTVKSVEGGMLTVEKTAKETWTFDVPSGTKGGTPKVGDKVTVYYKMVATEIESKAATATTPVKSAKKK